MNLNPKSLSRQLIAAFTILAILPGTPAFAQSLQYPVPYEIEQENAFITSTRILEDAILTINGDLRGIFRYPLENPGTTSLFLLGIGVLVLADKLLTSYYLDQLR